MALTRRVRTIAVTALTVSVAVVILAVAAYALVIVPDLPKLRTEPPSLDLASVVYSADGQEIARFYHQDRIWRSYDEISEHVIGALLATEDHRFYEHDGIDIRRTLSAVYHSLRGDIQGGSTISMQLARNLYPREIGSARTPIRKTKEIITAVKLERNFSKREILETYLNTVPFGNNAFGIEAAARRYFDRPASALEPHEAALLVGMLRGTSWYNPLRHEERALERRNLVLRRMLEHGYLTPAAHTEARARGLELHYTPGNPAGELAPHFADYVRDVAGEWADRHGYNLYTDGLRIHTTLDTRLQAAARESLERQVGALHAVAAYEWSAAGRAGPSRHPDNYRRQLAEGRFRPFDYLWHTRGGIIDANIRRTDRYRRAAREGDADAALAELRADAAFIDSLQNAVARLEGGLVAIDPATGFVKAWVGGRDYDADKFDKVARAKRQPGSAFKPVVYAAAVDFGFSPYHTFTDSLVTISLPGSRRTWTPTNAGGGASGAEMTLRDALVYSKNTITTQLVSDLGPHQIAGYAHRLGIESRMDAVPSIGLGTSEVSLLELTAAYATIAQNGIRSDPIVITRIEDRDGRELARFSPRPEKAISSFTAYTVLDMMRGVVRHGTGAPLRHQWGITADVAGKTGTTQNYADGWFVMMHPRLVAGAWVGFNDRRIAFRSSTWGYGGRNAIRVVGDFFSDVLELEPELANARFDPPPGYVPPRDPVNDPYLYVLDDGQADSDTLLRDAFYEGLEASRWDDSLEYADTSYTRYALDIDDFEHRRNEPDAAEADDADVERSLRSRVARDTIVQRVAPLAPDTAITVEGWD